ncbi:MAG: hypothetical protein Q8L48_03565 [Archangium sp.]|nr:hypothetical protein [Archangium sp.]
MRIFLFVLVLAAPVACKRSEPFTASTSAVLPTRDDGCVKDDDCDYDWTSLVDGQCCDGTCSPAPASKRHVEAVTRACKTLGFTPNCPMKKCAAPAPLKCVASRCVAIQLVK